MPAQSHIAITEPSIVGMGMEFYTQALVPCLSLSGWMGERGGSTPSKP